MDKVAECFTEWPRERNVSAGDVEIPRYLNRHYWWAYVHPWAVAFWDHLWIVNLILLGNFKRLRDAALREFDQGENENVLQISCVYGDITPNLAKRVVKNGGSLDVVDVLPIQLKNLRRKLADRRRIRLLNMDARQLNLPSQHYDTVMIFFLLHEQPKDVKARTLEEAFRVVKPGGKVVMVEFAKPYLWNPFRYLWCAFLAVFEPFALDMWWRKISDMVPAKCSAYPMKQERFFGGLFQKVVVSCPEA